MGEECLVLQSGKNHIARNITLALVSLRHTCHDTIHPQLAHVDFVGGLPRQIVYFNGRHGLCSAVYLLFLAGYLPALVRPPVHIAVVAGGILLAVDAFEEGLAFQTGQ